MKYLAFVGTEGAQPEDALERMRREWPAYQEELDRIGNWRLGRELNHPPAPVTVRVRAGQTLVTDGPFVETKEFVGGFDLFEAADVDAAIAVESKSPAVRFCAFEIRPIEQLTLGPQASAFAQGDDAAGIPHLLTTWIDAKSALRPQDPTALEEYQTWREDLEERNMFVLGGTLPNPETATTLRFSNGAIQTSKGPFLDIEAFIAGIDVIRAADRQHATQVAASHPLACYHAIEVQAFYTS